jgi:DNA invertase Pin-like site-specific DNA recombinase
MLGIYCRISKQIEEGKDRSIDDQRLTGVELANKLGFSYDVYIDEGFSGSLPIDKRPALNRLIDDIYSGKITSVYCYDQSRLERSLEARFAIAKVFTNENIDLYTANGLVGKDEETELIGNMFSLINNFYLKITSKKIKSVIKRNASNGKVHSIMPYGYAKGENNLMVIDEAQSIIIKRIFEYSLNGVGTNKIAEILDSEGVLTKYNLIAKGTLTTTNRNSKSKKQTTIDKSKIKWSGNTIRNIIINPVYKGVRIFSGVEYSCPVIIEPVMWQMVNDNLQSNRNNSGKVVDHKYLLKGLLTCGRCGRNIYGRRRTTLKDNAYICSSKRFKHLNCKNRGINIDALEKLIWYYFVAEGNLLKLIESHLSNLNTKDITLDIKAEIDAYKSRIKSLDTEKSNVVSSIAKGILNDEDAKGFMNSIRTEKESIDIKIYNLKEQLEAIQSNKFNLSSITSELTFSALEALDMPYNDKKTILNKYIDEIVIYFDDVEHYYLDIKLNVGKNVVLVLDKSYKVAYSAIDAIDDVNAIDFIYIVLNDKMNRKFKENKEIDASVMVNSMQMFEELKSSYKG